jgi:peptidoglycan/LPS O-acetylase OafA/YrhL
MIGTWAFLPCAGLTFAILIPAADVTYLLIERPGQKVGGMIIKRYRTRHSMFQAPLSPPSPTG